MVENRLAEVIAAFAALVVDPRIVSIAGVHANCDGDPLAGPSVRGADPVAAGKPAHDIGIVFFRAVAGVVRAVKSEREIFFLEQT